MDKQDLLLGPEPEQPMPLSAFEEEMLNYMSYLLGGALQDFKAAYPHHYVYIEGNLINIGGKSYTFNVVEGTEGIPC